METSVLITARDGARLAYWRTSTSGQDQAAVLLLHGAASNHTRFSEFLEMTQLTAQCTILRADLRGNGRSMWRGALDLRVWSQDLVEILNHEGLKDAILVGHSLGAHIAIDFAARFSERCRGLALIDPVVPAALTGWRLRASRFRQLARWAVRLLRATNALGLRRRDFPDRNLRQLDEETRQAIKTNPEDLQAIARRYGALGPILRYMPTANYLQQLLATISPLPDLKSITCPVLVLLSGGISFANPEINLRRLRDFPHAEITRIDANHWPLTEKPHDVRRQIEQWVEGLNP